MVAEIVTGTDLLIQNVARLIEVIIPIAIAVATYLKLNPKIIGALQSIKETDKWVLENEGKLLTVLEVSYNLTPEQAKAYVDDPRVKELIAKYNGDLRQVTEELKKLYGPLEIPDNVKKEVNSPV